MRRRSQPSHAAISLFPFLDTLMCTMGALILLLIALAIRMRPGTSLEEALKQAAAGLPVLTEDSREDSREQPPEPEAAPPPAYTAADRERDLAERAAIREKRQSEWSELLATARARRAREEAALDQQKRSAKTIQRQLQEGEGRLAQAVRDDDEARELRAAV